MKRSKGELQLEAHARNTENARVKKKEKKKTETTGAEKERSLITPYHDQHTARPNRGKPFRSFGNKQTACFYAMYSRREQIESVLVVRK